MAGIIKVDRVQSDSNLAFNIAGANVAFMDASALRLVGSGITANGTTIVSGGRVVAAAQPTGAILQVVQSVKTDIASFSGTTWSDITGMSITITPTSSTSKFYITYDMSMGGDSGAYSGGLKLVRNSTDLYLGDASSSRTRASSWFYTDYYNYSTWHLHGAYLDSPATASAITYKIQVMSGYSGRSVTMNYSTSNGDGIYHGRVPSQITVWEIAG